MRLIDARKIAVDLGTRLHPSCHAVNIAGSIRRRKFVVKDIELICVPFKQDVFDLFGNKSGEMVVNEFASTVHSFGKLIKGNSSGKYMQIDLGEINLDLFLPDAHDYYRQYAIRTGSAEFANKILATAWKRNGWCGSDKGLRRQSDCEQKIISGKPQWKCIREGERPPVWQSEEEFFDWLQVRYVDPQFRY